MKRLSEILKRCEAATPGPWQSDFCGDVWTISGEVPHVNDGGMELFRGIGTTARGPDRGDGVFIAHARTDLPLVTQVLMKAVDNLKRISENGGPNAGVGYTMQQNARVTLAEIEKLLGEK